jgi:hypothetical protein
MDIDLSHQISQDAFISVLFKQLDDEQSETRAAKGESERLEQHRGTVAEGSSEGGRATSGKRSGAKQKEKDQARQAKQDRLLAASSSTRQEPDDTGRSATVSKFEALPDNVQDIIFGMLLTSDRPIKLNTARLRAFVEEKTSVPAITTTPIKGLRKKSELKAPRILRLELEQMETDLRTIPRDQWPTNSVASGLTLSILHVSKRVHQRAAESLYSNNVFKFYSPSDAWLHLESFLLTIGQRNANNIQRLSITPPKWYPDASGDRVAGALLDALSPITRLATSTNTEEDRLLSAISTCTSVLTAQGSLKSLQLDMPFGGMHFFLGDHRDVTMYVLSTFEKDNRKRRREDGIQRLRALSDALSPESRPELVIHANTHRNHGKKKKLYDHLYAVQLEAEKYGWDVNRTLMVSDKFKAQEDG